MERTRLIISGLWVALMLIYLLGDVIRIFAGDFEPGKMDGKPASPSMWLGAALIMLIPIIMLVLTLILGLPAIRIINIIVPIIMLVFNIFGLPYKGVYDNVLIGVSFIVNLITIFYAWGWK